MTRSNGSLLRQQASLIPRWAGFLAAAVFLAAAGALLYLFSAHESNPPPLLLQVPFSLFMAFFPALWILVVAHVNQDARRRGLNAWFWTLVALFTPNALGAIFYYVFVFVRPATAYCPACGAGTRAGSRFCSACGRELRPACPACSRPIEPEDAYCPSCGRALSVNGPADSGLQPGP